MSKEIDDLLKQVFGDGKRRRPISSINAEDYLAQSRKPQQAPEGSPQEERPQEERPRAGSLQAERAQAESLSRHISNSLDTQRAAADALEQTRRTGASINAQLEKQLEEMKRMSRELEQTLPGNEPVPSRSAPVQAERTAGAISPSLTPAGREETAASLSQAAKSACTRLPGQAQFLNQLGIAFKRPYVTGWDAPEGARGVLFVHGGAGSGRHTALKHMAAALSAVGQPGTLVRLDLALYPSQNEERLFLQDLYGALQTGGVVVFDGYEACHPAFLQQLAQLLCTGRLPLNARYVMQNGHLVDAGTALSKNTVNHLSANGCYLVLVSQRDEAALADSFGAGVVNALTDLCRTQLPDAQATREIAALQLERLSEKCSAMLGFSLELPEDFAAVLAKEYTPQAGATPILDTCRRCYQALAQYKLEHDTPATTVKLSRKDGVLFADFGAGSIDLLSLLPTGYQGALEAVKAEMSQVIGLAEIKQYILSLEDHFRVQAMRKAQGMKAAPLSMHMIFTGNPGTGKTTIARLVSRYLKAIGVLSGGQLVEVTRADLVGKYVGHTAPLTTQVLKSALGGVLFIDEAYSLYRGKDDSFGLEAIDTLVKGMEDHREDLVVILAGYTKEMELFLTANSGLKSRFPNIIQFPDYRGEELTAIAKLTAKGKGYQVTEQAAAALTEYFCVVQAMENRESGNGRLARNVVERAILAQSKRVILQPDAALDVLEQGDFDLFQ